MANIKAMADKESSSTEKKYSVFFGRWQPWHNGHRWKPTHVNNVDI